MDLDQLFPNDKSAVCKDRWKNAVQKVLLIDENEGSKGVSLFTTSGEINEGK